MIIVGLAMFSSWSDPSWNQRIMHFVKRMDGSHARPANCREALCKCNDSMAVEPIVYRRLAEIEKLEEMKILNADISFVYSCALRL